MTTLIQIYAFALLAALTTAPALALLGAQLAARDKAMQTLCVGQGATLGVLLGLGTLKLLDAPDLLIHLGPLVTAVLFSVGTYFLSEKATGRFLASKNTFFAAIFASLLGLGYFVCAVFPPLENHMSQVFFGDLATLSNWESILAISIGIITTIFFSFNARALTYDSFYISVFGHKQNQKVSFATRYFDFLAILLLSYSVQFLGFLFTITTLFLPTILAKISSNRYLSRHLFSIALLSGLASLSGFLLSLYYSRIPTVPTILLMMLLLGFVSFYRPRK